MVYSSSGKGGNKGGKDDDKKKGKITKAKHNITGKLKKTLQELKAEHKKLSIELETKINNNKMLEKKINKKKTDPQHSSSHNTPQPQINVGSSSTSESNPNPPIISILADKGGVGKTTLVFNLAWYLSTVMGKKILLVDCDPQTNLTDSFLDVANLGGANQYEQKVGSSIYRDDAYHRVDGKGKPVRRDNEYYNIWEALQMVVDMGYPDVSPYLPRTYAHRLNDKVRLLAGHEKIVLYGERVSGAHRDETHYGWFGAFHSMVKEVAARDQVDIVLIDSAPGPTTMNLVIMLSSNYYMVPCFPDIYSYRGLKKATDRYKDTNVTFGWPARIRTMRQFSLNYRSHHQLPNYTPEFLGVVFMNYRSHNDDAALAFQHWANEIQTYLKAPHGYVQDVAESDTPMVVNQKFLEQNYMMGEIRRMDSVMPLANKLGIPVLELLSLSAGTTANDRPTPNQKKQIKKAFGYGSYNSDRSMSSFGRIIAELPGSAGLWPDPLPGSAGFKNSY